MGLDNGIDLVTRRPPETFEDGKWRFPSYTSFEHGYNDKDDEGFNRFTVCYWRKCWNIRNKILGILHMNNDEYERDDVTVNELKQIRETLLRYIKYPWEWNNDENGDSIWEFEEADWNEETGLVTYDAEYSYLHNLTRQVAALSWLIKYLRESGDMTARARFYDSY